MDSIIVTVFDRDPVTLACVLRGLVRNKDENVEVVVMDDGSTVDYGPLPEMFAGVLGAPWVRHSAPADCYRIGASKNPMSALAHGLELVHGERIYHLAGDLELPPGAIERARMHDFDRVVWSPRVVDMWTAKEYTGPSRVFPALWFLGTSRLNWSKSGGPDLGYMGGMAFDDNDLSARLGLAAGRLVIDGRVTAWHHSHEPLAYSDDLRGYRLNEAYTIKKWGFRPWWPECKIKKRASLVVDTVIVDMEHPE